MRKLTFALPLLGYTLAGRMTSSSSGHEGNYGGDIVVFTRASRRLQNMRLSTTQPNQLLAVHQSRRRICVKALASFTSQIRPYLFLQHTRSRSVAAFAGDDIRICGRLCRFLVPFQAEEAEQIRKTPQNKQVAPCGFTGNKSHRNCS